MKGGNLTSDFHKPFVKLQSQAAVREK